MLSAASWATLHKVFTCAILSQKYYNNIAQGFYLYSVVPRQLRQHWTWLFPIQYCLEPQGQHCLGYLLVQCCPKSIKTTLSKIFSCAMLSETSWVTLHKVFTCAMLAHCQQTTFLSKKTYIYNAVSIKPGQHCIWTLYSQCCSNTSETTLRRKITGEMLALTTWSSIRWKITIYNVVLICLSQHCTRKWLVHFDPQTTNKFVQKYNLQYCLNLFGLTLHKEITCGMLAHSHKTTLWGE